MDFNFTEEQRMFRDLVRDFVQKEIQPFASPWEEEGRVPPEVISKMAKLGICGVAMPQEYGGGEGGETGLCIATEEICRASAGLGTGYLVGFGVSMDAIIKHGTQEQKRQYIPRNVDGAVAYFAVTESIGGSDVAGMQTSYVREGESYILNGTKIFITNGIESEFGTVFATRDKKMGYRGISCFVVEKGTPGFSVGKREKKTGQHCNSTTELIFDNCKIPSSNLVGEEGKGFKIAIEAIDASRASVAAQAVGIAEAAYEAALNYAKERKAFGKSLAEMQAIQWMIADMALDIDASRLLIYRAAWLIDNDQPFLKEGAMAKLFASEAAHRVCHKAVQIHGGYGYTEDFPVERYARDQRITEIYEGTSEMQRWAISRQVLGIK
jgi:butyryl-CoA dehydrogenase